MTIAVKTNHTETQWEVDNGEGRTSGRPLNDNPQLESVAFSSGWAARLVEV